MTLRQKFDPDFRNEIDKFCLHGVIISYNEMNMLDYTVVSVGDDSCQSWSKMNCETASLSTSREMWVFNGHWYIKWLKSVFRSQNRILLNIKKLQYEMANINRPNTIII